MEQDVKFKDANWIRVPYYEDWREIVIDMLIKNAKVDYPMMAILPIKKDMLIMPIYYNSEDEEMNQLLTVASFLKAFESNWYVIGKLEHNNELSKQGFESLFALKIEDNGNMDSSHFIINRSEGTIQDINDITSAGRLSILFDIDISENVIKQIRDKNCEIFNKECDGSTSVEFEKFLDERFEKEANV